MVNYCFTKTRPTDREQRAHSSCGDEQTKNWLSSNRATLTVWLRELSYCVTYAIRHCHGRLALDFSYPPSVK
jgi:hypothetical protein